MPPSKSTYDSQAEAPRSVLREDGIEYGFIGRLQGLKYEPSGARQTGRKASPQGERGAANQFNRFQEGCVENKLNFSLK